MLFQPELGWSVLELMGQSADSVRWTPLQKQETKRIDEGSLVAFHRWGGLVFIMDDHDNFPSLMMI